MNRCRILIGWIAILLFAIPLAAQESLAVDKIFSHYGKQKGVTLVDLSTDVLSGNSKIVRYRSLLAKPEKELVVATLKAIQADVKKGSKIVETSKDGKIELGYYCLSAKPSDKMNEYILYKNKSDKLVLIYLKGKFPPRKLEEELDALKDLFIYVNKKRVKLH